MTGGNASSPRDVTIRTLGPLEVTVDGRPVALPPSRRRLLAILTLDVGRSCPRDELIDRMWGDTPPATARTALQVNISELRRTVPIDTTSGGYRVALDAVEHDAVLLGRLVAEARSASEAEAWSVALAAAERAGALWRGEPFPDLRAESYAAGAIARIEELFLAGADLEIEALLALGRNDAVIIRVGDLLDRHPFNDRLRRHLMLAMYRAGRQGEALRAYQNYRRTLGEAIGIEPGDDLRDLEQRILLHDPGLGETPAPVVPHNLPEPGSSFIGRDDEIRAIAKELRASRLVTLTGGPGFGKTRLAVEAGRHVLADYPGGVWFVALGGSGDAPSVAATVASTVVPGDRLEGLEDLAGHVRERPMLLILDNCEQVIEPVARLVHALSPKTATCRVLVTGRRRLGIDGEFVMRLQPLAMERDEPLALLVDRVRAVDRTFAVDAAALDTLAHVCERLDGIPLALELLARWVPSLGLGDVARLLDRVHADSALAAAFEWSLSLLPAVDGHTLGRLAAFASPFTLERAVAVCSDRAGEPAVAGSVSRLVDASLLVLDRSERPARYRMPEPIRDLAWRRLAARARRTTARRHADSFVASAGPLAPASTGGRQAEAFATLDVEIADYRRTMAHLAAQRRWSEHLTVVDALSRYWYARFLGWEGRERLAAIPVDELDPGERVRLHRMAGFLAWAVHDYDDADRHYTALCDLGVALSAPVVRADGLYGRGLIHQKRRFLDGAAMLDDAAAIYERVGGCDQQLGECLLFRGLDEAYTGDVAEAEVLLGRALELLERTGHLRQVSKTRRWLAHCAWRREDESEARRQAALAEQIARSVGDDIALGGALVERAHVELTWGEDRVAAQHLLDALDPIPVDDEIDRAQVLFPVARLALDRGERETLRTIVDHVDDVYRRHGWRPFDEIVGVDVLRGALGDGAATSSVNVSVGEAVQDLLSRAVGEHQHRSTDAPGS